MVIGVPIITTTTPKTGLIFMAFRDLLTPTRCRVIDNKTEGIINHCLRVFLIVFLIMIFYVFLDVFAFHFCIHIILISWIFVYLHVCS